MQPISFRQKSLFIFLTLIIFGSAYSKPTKTVSCPTHLQIKAAQFTAQTGTYAGNTFHFTKIKIKNGLEWIAPVLSKTKSINTSTAQNISFKKAGLGIEQITCSYGTINLTTVIQLPNPNSTCQATGKTIVICK